MLCLKLSWNFVLLYELRLSRMIGKRRNSRRQYIERIQRHENIDIKYRSLCSVTQQHNLIVSQQQQHKLHIRYKLTHDNNDVVLHCVAKA